MSFKFRIKPKFWDYRDVAAGPYTNMFNLRRIWYLSVLLTAGAALAAVFFLAAIDYKVTQKSIESENMLRISRLVSNARRTLSFFLVERRSALEFLARDNSFETLSDQNRLLNILRNLQKSFGGFTDLGLIDSYGRQINYIGPYDLASADYSEQRWFAEVKTQGSYTSDVFLGLRQSPHMVLAVYRDTGGDSNFILRATIEAENIHHKLANMETDTACDLFVVNRDGVLQTPSRFFGKILEKISLPVPEGADSTEIFETLGRQGETLFVGYAYIKDTPFILMAVKNKDEMMRPWFKARAQITTYLLTSVAVILLVVLAVATYLVSRIHAADQKRVIALHQVEYANKLASIGRLAAGVAHEINNPLAIINEKAGLITDLLKPQPESQLRTRLIQQTEVISASVQRCAAITRRLLGFARHMDVSIEDVNLKEIIESVLSFLKNEAQHRAINIDINVSPDIPVFKSDRGKLQQIFLNLINNAFAALEDGGNLTIEAKRTSNDSLTVSIIDNGCGIPPEDLKLVFEPFFSTKTKKGGTGLGLSITYGLVQEIGGSINVTSQVDEGTRFNIVLPLKPETKDETH
ncbi:MAG: ATP-binding protein [Desulfatiglandaceae bacterium]